MLRPWLKLSVFFCGIAVTRFTYRGESLGRGKMQNEEARRRLVCVMTLLAGKVRARRYSYPMMILRLRKQSIPGPLPPRGRGLLGPQLL